MRHNQALYGRCLSSMLSQPTLTLAFGTSVLLCGTLACSDNVDSGAHNPGAAGTAGTGVVANAGTAGTGIGTAGTSAGGTAGAAGTVAVAGTAGVAGSAGAAMAGAGGGAGTTMGAPCATTAGDNAAGLTVRFPEIGTRSLGQTPNGSMMRIRHDPLNDRLVAMSQGGEFWTVDTVNGGTTPLATGEPQNNNCRSMTFDSQGTLYVQCHQGNIGVIIEKGTPDGAGGYTWSTLVTSTPYPPPAATGANFGHAFNGIVVSPDDQTVYFGSGSRSDHGEMEDGNRELPLTSAIFMVPASSDNLMLMNDETALAPYLYADGTRNTFDMAFNDVGDLIGTENGPDMDLPDEINFLEQGKHYGFPWRMGDVDNPTIDPMYDPAGDMRLHGGYQAVDNNLYQGDATFPPAPATFTDPILNHGPDSDKFRPGAAGAATDASDTAATLAGITPHKSPLGINFDTQGTLCGDYFKAGFFVNYGAVGDFFSDAGRDLVMLKLTKVGAAYEATMTQLVAGLEAAPIDAELVGNKIYIVEFGGGSEIIEVTLPMPAQ